MTDTSPATLEWETDLPLLSRFMLRQWTLAMLATAFLMIVLLGIVFAAQQEWDVMPMMFAIIGAVTGALWLLGLIIMIVLFRGRYLVRFSLSNTGIRCDTLDRVARTSYRLAIVVGILAPSPQAVGAGLIGRSRESEEVRWRGSFKAVYDPAAHSIYLRNAWRTLLWVQCTPENYAEVAAAVDSHMRQRKTASRVSGKSPVPAYLGRSLLVIASCYPLFLLAEEFDTGLFLPILILCFALATVWLINLFGWVVIGGLIAQVVMVAIDQMEMRESFFNKGEFYRAWEVLGGDDISLLFISGIGAAVLIWLSLQALRGRWLAALLEGYKDMEG
jgi:hypothetical protein